MLRNREHLIRSLFDEYIEMYASRDDRLTERFSEDFSGYTGGGDFLVRDRNEWKKITRQDFAQVAGRIRIEMLDLMLQDLSDDVVVVTAFFHIHLPIDDQILSRETARLVLIFRLENKDWKIAHSGISIPYHLVRDGEVYPLQGLHERNRELEALVAARTVELKAREERFQALFERASDGIMIASPGGRLIAANESFAKMHGYGVDEMLGMNLEDLDTPDVLQLMPERMQRILSGEAMTFEVEHYHKDGHVIPLEVSASLILSDGEPLIQSFHRDITERKRTEVALRENEALFRLLTEDVLDVIWKTDRDLRFTYISPADERLRGFRADEVIGHHVLEMFTEEGSAAVRQIMHARQETERHGAETAFRTFEVQHRCKDGSLLWGEVFSTVERDSHGTITGYHGITREITKRKQAEAARAELEAQLRESQKMEALGTLAGGVAHDFNNALAMIIGNVELARQDVGPGHAALVSLDEIGKASRRAKDLVQQILSFGRRQTLERRATSLALAVVETARLVRATLPAAASLVVNCESDAPAVLADAAQIKQILLNLCSNALAAIQDLGRDGVIEIDLSAHTHKEGQTPSELQPGRYACLAVRDNGSGMDEATRSHIFEPFFTTKPVGTGTGLGLSVVHGIVKSHGASMAIESAPGTGSTFRIYFPAVEAPVPSETASAPSAAPVQGKGKHILYVDDEEAIIFLMRRLLERQGFRVSGYTDPREAVAAVRDKPDEFDLAVTDYNMPGMSGLEVASALRSIRADLPVVLASGYITEELRQKAPAAGVRELIYKPNTVDDLCEAVARCANAQSKIAP
jgi:PAS domain S-box-containing protein